jgi:NitT/TauT family transport system substrate-binding protein
MKTTLKVWLLLLAVVVTGAVGLAGCSPANKPASEDQASEGFEIYAPASTSSIPVLLAASQTTNFHVTLYSNQSQANTLFVRGDVPIFVTGLSVGQDLYKQDVPIQLANSFVSGLSYLVTTGSAVNSFADLKGKEIYIPFEGSPIEDVSAYFAAQEGLTWKEDITPVYSPFDSSVALLKEGKAAAVVLPEPFVSLLEGQDNIFISISYFDQWNKANPQYQGYPQVGTFVNTQWAAGHTEQIAQFNQALADAIAQVEADPQTVVDVVAASYSFPPKILLNSLGRIHFDLISGAEMKDRIERYDTTIGKLQNEIDAAFYYLPAK